MNIPFIRKTKSPATEINQVQILRSFMSAYLFKLNARINAKSMSHHHRMGSWQGKSK